MSASTETPNVNMKMFDCKTQLVPKLPTKDQSTPARPRLERVTVNGFFSSAAALAYRLGKIAFHNYRTLSARKVAPFAHFYGVLSEKKENAPLTTLHMKSRKAAVKPRPRRRGRRPRPVWPA